MLTGVVLIQGLFCKIESYECLNYVMNQNSRDKRQETAPTVCATIDQFNRVSLAVIATVLQTTDPTGTHCSTHRGKALTRWIEVAQVIVCLCVCVCKDSSLMPTMPSCCC